MEALKRFVLDRSLRVKIFGGFFALILILIVVSSANLNLIKAINTQLLDINHVYTPALEKATKIKTIVLKQQSIVYASFAPMDAKATKAEREKALWDNIQSFRRLDREFNFLVKDLSNSVSEIEEREAINSIQRAHDEFSYIANSIFSQTLKGNKQMVNQLIPNYDFVADEIIKIADEFDQRFFERLDLVERETTESLSQGIQDSIVYLLVGIIISFFLTGLLSHVILKPISLMLKVMNDVSSGKLYVSAPVFSKDEIGRLAVAFNGMIKDIKSLILQIQANSEEMVSFSQDFRGLASSSSELSETVMSQVSRVEQEAKEQARELLAISKSIQSVVREISSISDNSHVISDISQDSSNIASMSSEKSHEALKQIKESETHIIGTAEVIEDLYRFSKEISKVTQIINQFARNTNLLSYNAAIEAARAGESGKGFAVVADEVRALANASSQSVKEIQNLINKVQQTTKSAVESVRSGSISIKEGRKVVKEAVGTFEQIVVGVQEVTASLQDITASIEQITCSSQSNQKQIEALLENASNTVDQTNTVKEKVFEQTALLQQFSVRAENLELLAQKLQKKIAHFDIKGES